jgi:ABC-type uncharacterized transport system substrate-binding protein
MRRIGVLMSTAADDSEGQARIAAFLQGLQQLGWTAGRNVQIEYRWTAGAPERARSYARELAALAPDVIVTGGASYVAALQATRTVPIVFATATDPQYARAPVMGSHIILGATGEIMRLN